MQSTDRSNKVSHSRWFVIMIGTIDIFVAWIMKSNVMMLIVINRGSWSKKVDFGGGSKLKSDGARRFVGVGIVDP